MAKCNRWFGRRSFIYSRCIARWTEAQVLVISRDSIWVVGFLHAEPACRNETRVTEHRVSWNWNRSQHASRMHLFRIKWEHTKNYPRTHAAQVIEKKNNYTLGRRNDRRRDRFSLFRPSGTRAQFYKSHVYPATFRTKRYSSWQMGRNKVLGWIFSPVELIKV